MVNYSIYSLLYKMSLMTSHLRMQKHTYQNIRISYTHFYIAKEQLPKKPLFHISYIQLLYVFG